MENDFIPGNTPQGNRTTLLLRLSSNTHLRSLVFQRSSSFVEYTVCTVYTYWPCPPMGHAGLEHPRGCYSRCVRVCTLTSAWSGSTDTSPHNVIITSLFSAHCASFWSALLRAKMPVLVPVHSASTLQTCTVAAMSSYMILGTRCLYLGE